jgi:hypothetical protein
MAIHIRTLRSAANRSSRSFAAKSLNEARSLGKQTAFLCHSHNDGELALGLQNFLLEQGWELYIDWQDTEMPPSPNKVTAGKIKSKISENQWFLFLATPNSTKSRWCPWEIGYADSVKGYEKILMVPTTDDSGQWYGNEYLQLYKRITHASNSITNRSGYAIFGAGDYDNGIWVNNL